MPEARTSNLRHRPIGLGVQGLADAFMLMRYPFDSAEARELNIKIFETIYHAALEASCELAQRDGPYETYVGSPVSKGIFQYDMWDVTPTDLWNWDELKQNIAKRGVRNSLLVAPMPTASTSQILGFNECFEPYTSNLYTRRVLAGEFQIVNPWLLKDLVESGLWDDNVKNQIISDNGSIQHVASIPQNLKDLYKTVWEISQRVVIDMAADRGAFIDQSQSLNIFIAEPNFGRLTSMHFYAWKKGLKTGMYYLRTRPAVDAIKVRKETIGCAQRKRWLVSLISPVLLSSLSTKLLSIKLSTVCPLKNIARRHKRKMKPPWFALLTIRMLASAAAVKHTVTSLPSHFPLYCRVL